MATIFLDFLLSLHCTFLSVSLSVIFVLSLFSSEASSLASFCVLDDSLQLYSCPEKPIILCLAPLLSSTWFLLLSHPSCCHKSLSLVPLPLPTLSHPSLSSDSYPIRKMSVLAPPRIKHCDQRQMFQASPEIK